MLEVQKDMLSYGDTKKSLSSTSNDIKKTMVDEEIEIVVFAIFFSFQCFFLLGIFCWAYSQRRYGEQMLENNFEGTQVMFHVTEPPSESSDIQADEEPQVIDRQIRRRSYSTAV